MMILLLLYDVHLQHIIQVLLMINLILFERKVKKYYLLMVLFEGIMNYNCKILKDDESVQLLHANATEIELNFKGKKKEGKKKPKTTTTATSTATQQLKKYLKG